MSRNIETGNSPWTTLSSLPYSFSSACVVKDQILAIGGQETDTKEKKKISRIYKYNHEENRWDYLEDMPHACSFVDSFFFQSQEELVVADAENQSLFISKVKSKLIIRPNKFVTSVLSDFGALRYQPVFNTEPNGVDIPVAHVSGKRKSLLTCL